MLNLVLVVTGFSLGVLICLELGWRIRHARSHEDDPDADSGLSAVDGAVFGLMGLLIAFTFTGAATRFDFRRDLILRETNAMGTVWLRVDLLPATAQPALRKELRDYVDSRIRLYQLLSTDIPEAKREFARGNALQMTIWKDAEAACQQQSSPAVTMLVTSSLNDMIDMTTTRYMALLTHPPLAIYLVLGFLVLGSSLLAGYGMGRSRRRAWTHRLVYAVTLALAMYVIFDLEYPRLGLIRIDAADQIMVNQRKSMN